MDHFSPAPTSLMRQATRRLVAAFLVVVAVAVGAGVLLYRASLERTAAFELENRVQFFEARLVELEARRGLLSAQVRAQLEYTRIMEESANRGQRLAAYLTQLGGETEFAQALVADRRGTVLARFGSEAERLPDPFLPADHAGWHYLSEAKRLFRVYSQPLWLGPQEGNGRLVLFFPVDNGLISRINVYGATLTVFWEGMAVASSLGEEGLKGIGAHAAVEGLTHHRDIPWTADGTDEAPELEVQYRFDPPLTPTQAGLAGLAFLTLLLVLIWLILGRWLLTLATELATLSEASRAFMQGYHCTPEVLERLQRARQAPEVEVGEVAHALADLTQAVEERDRRRDASELALRESEERYRSLLAAMGDGVVLQDAAGGIVLCNPAAERMLGLTFDQMAGRTSLDQRWRAVRGDGTPFPGEEHPAALTLATGKSQRGVVMGVLKPAGYVSWISINTEPLFNPGEPRPRGVVCSFTDITERREAENQLRLLASVFQHSGEAILITDRHNRILAVNPAFTAVTGYLEQDVIGKDPKILSAGHTTPEVYAAMWAALLGPGFWQGEVWDRRKDGSVYPKWLAISVVRDDQGEIVSYVGAFSDITERKRAEERIFHLAHHDALTELPNRFALRDRLEQAIEIARRNDERLAVLFVDLDHFKVINDTLGHHVGDGLLVQVAGRLLASVRASDIVARLGGDEFVVVMTGMNEIHASVLVARKLIREIGRPYTVEDHVLHTTPSIGIALFPADGQEAETLMKNADTAMYHVKAQGRNNYQFFTENMNLAAFERLRLESSLRQAVERGEFLLHYQPQLDMRTNKVRGVEALIRWQHPEEGMVAPGRFIGLAEETGLIIPLGHWILREACRQLREWKEQGLVGIRMAVNLSAHQLQQAGMPGVVQGLLREYGLSGEELELEITETVAMKDAEATVQRLRAIRALGVELAIDDFGTGYSSLNYLKLLPIQRLKLDRSFVTDIETDPNDSAICAATIALAHTLGLEQVAEGVETVGQLARLMDMGVDLVQGFLFSRPLPADEVADFIRRRNG